MKLLSQYLNHALNFESLAATETNAKLKAALADQARAYRKLAAERAAKLGLPQPSEPGNSFRTPSLAVVEQQEARDDGKSV
jgi:hypothetical protein